MENLFCCTFTVQYLCVLTNINAHNLDLSSICRHWLLHESMNHPSFHCTISDLKTDWSWGLCTERECSQLAQHQQLTGIHWVSQLSDLTWPGPSSQPAFPASHWSPACQHWPLIGRCQLTNTMSYVTLWQLRHQETQKIECHTHFQRYHSDLSAINYCKRTLFHWTTNVDWCGQETEFYNGHEW